MKKFAIIFIFSFLYETINAQSEVNQTQTDQFVNDIVSGLSKYRTKFKEGENDSLTFALLSTLFTNPDTKYEFNKINPRIGEEVYVNITHSADDHEQITFNEWINTRLHVLDATQWEIRIKTYVRTYVNENGDGTTRTVTDKIIRLKNIVTDEQSKIIFVYTDSVDGTCSNLWSVNIQELK